MDNGHEMNSDIVSHIIAIKESQARTETEVANIKETLGILPRMDARISDLENMRYKMLGVAGVSGGGVAGAWEFIQSLFKHVK